MCNCPGAGLWFAGMIALALGWSALPDILTGLAYAAHAGRMACRPMGCKHG